MGVILTPAQQANQSQLGFGTGIPGMGSTGFNDISAFGVGTPVPNAVTGGTANIGVQGAVQQPTGGLPNMQATTQQILANSGMAPDAAAGAAGQQGWFGKIGGMEGIGTILDGIGDIGGIYAALKQLGLARQQLSLSRESYETNLTNQTQSYNTALEDRKRAQASAEGTSAAEVDAYLKKHSL